MSEKMDKSYPQDPFDLFLQWFNEASEFETNDPNAMSLATVDRDGHPSVRIVLLKSVDKSGFYFFTNLDSRKGLELSQNPHVCLNFHWKSLQRQVRIYGTAAQISAEEADAYFASRPIGAQIGAWASQQSQELESRSFLEQELARYSMLFGDNPVPRPPHWSGFRVVPSAIEFWQERPFRLHDRIFYKQSNADQKWHVQRLYP